MMRNLIYSAFLVMLSCTHPVMAADAGSCYTIADADARAYCLAKARSDSGTCYTIQDSAKRSMCLAEVRR